MREYVFGNHFLGEGLLAYSVQVESIQNLRWCFLKISPQSSKITVLLFPARVTYQYVRFMIPINIAKSDFVIFHSKKKSELYEILF